METEEKIPAGFAKESFDSAVIDFKDFKFDASMKIEDPTSARAAEMIKVFQQEQQKDTPDTVRIQAAWLKAYAVAIEGADRVKVFNSDLPAPGASIEEWMKFTGSLKRKVAQRLVDGISYFHADSQKTGN